MADPKVTQATLKTKDQTQLMKAITDALTSGSGPLADIFGKFDEGAFNKGVTEPAMKNFQERILPQLQEQFAGGGRGSGQRDAQLRAGTDLQSQLAQLMYGAQNQQAQNRIAGVQNQVGQNTFENIVQQPKPKTDIWSGIIKGLGTAGAGFLGGPGGAALANSLFGLTDKSGTGATTKTGAANPNAVDKI
jgi:hypothetical protein